MVSNLRNEEFTIDAIQFRAERIYDANNKLLKTIPRRIYIPITHFKDGISSFFSTYEENLTTKNNSQYSLTFSINKYVNNQTNPVFYLITEGRRLRLQIASENENKPKIIDFVITSVTPKVTNKNNVLSVTCQDVFSYEVSKMNISISYASDGPQTYYTHLEQVLTLSGLGNRYKLKSSLSPEGQAPAFTNPFTLDTTSSFNALKTTVNIENSTIYNALVQLATDFNALLDITYPEYIENEDGTWDLTPTYIDFINIRNSRFEGYIVRPETNLNSFSVSRKTDNMNSILYVSGGEDADGLMVSVMPSMPSTVQEFFEKALTNSIQGFDWNASSNEWYNLYRANYEKILYTGAKSNRNNRTLIDEVDYYWYALTKLIPSAGNFLYNFDYYKEAGLLSSEDYNYLNDKISIELRSANIKQNLFASQYYRLQSELENIHSAELDYATFIASDMEHLYDLERQSSGNTNNQELNLETNLNDNTINYLNDLINLWADKNYRYIQNYKMFYDISSTPKSETITLNGLINDTNFKLTDNKTLNNENGITNENLFKNYFSFTFNYMQDKAKKVAQLYNDSCKEYKEIYNQLVNLFSPYLVEGGKYKLGSNEYDSIDVLLSISDDDLEEIISDQLGSQTLYIDYAYYREQMKNLRTKIGSYYFDEDDNLHYRLGIYFTYLELLFVLDNIRIGNNKILVEDWLASLELRLNLTFEGIPSCYASLLKVSYPTNKTGPVDFSSTQQFSISANSYTNPASNYSCSLVGEVWDSALSLGVIDYCETSNNNLSAYKKDKSLLFECTITSSDTEFSVSSFSDPENLGIKHIQITDFVFTFNGTISTIWSKHPVTYNLQQLKTEAETTKAAIWTDLYEYYGDFITEGQFTDSDQLTSEGLYIAASKQFAAYCQPTIEYSTTVINQNEILGFNSKLGLGDIIHFYNKELLEGYNGHIVIEVPKQSFLVSSVQLKCPIWTLKGGKSTDDYDFEYVNCIIAKTENKENSTLLYIKEESVEKAKQLLTTPFELYILEEIPVLNKYLDTIAKPIELQVTGLSTKLRSGTTQITVSNNKTVNAMLGRLLRQIK